MDQQGTRRERDAIFFTEPQQRLKARASQLRDEIWREVDRGRTDALATARDAVDEAEERRDDEERNAEEERDTGELHDIEAALARIDAGTYGKCRDCGIDIPLDRRTLNQPPFAAPIVRRDSKKTKPLRERAGRCKRCCLSRSSP
jgi:DnaK suppressor protein